MQANDNKEMKDLFQRRAERVSDFNEKVVRPKFDLIHKIVQKIKEEALQNTITNDAVNDGFLQDDFI